MKKVIRTLAVAAVFAAANAFATQLPGPLVETDWLAAHQNEVTIIALRADVKNYTQAPQFTKDKKTGKPVLLRVGGHIPGATLVNYKQVRSKRVIDGHEVDKMIPDKAQFEKLLQAAGVDQDSAIVIVTKGLNNLDMTMATRLYWQLKYYGHDNVAILNGGLAQWLLDGRKIATAASETKAGNWKATAERTELLATSDDVAKATEGKTMQLMDNRPLAQYLGTYKKSYVYEKGHIPGAKSFPNELLTEPGAPAKFLPVDELRQLAGEMGLKTNDGAIAYCNSGHLASGGWFIMSELMGNKNVKLYDGSMHEWTLEKRPVTKMKME